MARRRCPNWRSSFTPIRTRSGRRSFRKGPPRCSVLVAAPGSHADRRCNVVTCQDRRADAGERVFGRSAQQSGPAERKAMIDARTICRSPGRRGRLTSPGQRLLPASSGVPADLAIMRRLDRLHLEVPFRREPHVARLAGCRGVQDPPSSREGADEAEALTLH